MSDPGGTAARAGDDPGRRLANIVLKVNGRPVRADVEPRLLLVHFLREHLRLTGTHIGCDTSQCGACTVHLDGRPVKSCTLLAVQADGCEITTIEGLAAEGSLHPLQAAFQEHHALQCGFCTPGIVMAAHELLGCAVNPTIVEGQIHGGLAQGIGQALMEGAEYDASGQPLAGSFLDYATPRAADLPCFEVEITETPSTVNPLGARGIGEAGAIGAPPAVVNAVLDALAPFGVRALDMPLTPQKIWRAIREARA